MDKEGNKTGGRSKGTPNKRNQEIYELAEDLGCNPVKILMLFALRDYDQLGLSEFTETTTKSGDKIKEPTISPELQKSAASDLMPYMYGKRKPIDSNGDDSNDPVTAFIEALSGSK